MRKAQDWSQPCPNSECSLYKRMHKGNVSAISTYMTLTTFARTGKRGRPKNPVMEPHPDLVYGQLIKQKEEGRLKTIRTRVLLGAKRFQECGGTISTALIERVNLTMRQALAPLVRKTYSFCKDREQMRRRVVFFQTFYNVARPHQSLRTPLPVREHVLPGIIRPKWAHRTPGMAAGITDHVWTFRELLTVKFDRLDSRSIRG